MWYFPVLCILRNRRIVCFCCIKISFSFSRAFYNLWYTQEAFHLFMKTFKYTEQNISLYPPHRHTWPIGGLRLFSALWSGSCLLEIFPIAILNFIFELRLFMTPGIYNQLILNVKCGWKKEQMNYGQMMQWF